LPLRLKPISDVACYVTGEPVTLSKTRGRSAAPSLLHAKNLLFATRLLATMLFAISPNDIASRKKSPPNISLTSYHQN
jgi:hypothetical protein